MLHWCVSDKGKAKLYIQLFRFKKNRSKYSTRSISEILKPFKKFAVMYTEPGNTLMLVF